MTLILKKPTTRARQLKHEKRKAFKQELNKHLDLLKKPPQKNNKYSLKGPPKKGEHKQITRKANPRTTGRARASHRSLSPCHFANERSWGSAGRSVFATHGLIDGANSVRRGRGRRISLACGLAVRKPRSDLLRVLGPSYAWGLRSVNPKMKAIPGPQEVYHQVEHSRLRKKQKRVCFWLLEGRRTKKWFNWCATIFFS